MSVSASDVSVFDLLDPPVWIVTAQHETTVGGFVATFVMNASIVPDERRVIAGVARQHFTHRLIQSSGRLALHLAAADSVPDVVHFGLHSGHEDSKFPWQGATLSAREPPELPGAAGRLVADVETQLNIGDRTLFVCRVVSDRPLSDRQPLTMSQLIPQLDDKQRATLQTLLLRDMDRDRQAIHDWRRRLEGESSSA